jgi:hypothetical protein
MKISVYTAVLNITGIRITPDDLRRWRTPEVCVLGPYPLFCHLPRVYQDESAEDEDEDEDEDDEDEDEQQVRC